MQLRINRLITFNGPTVLPTFGEFGKINEFTVEYFKKALFLNKPIGVLGSSNEFSDENLWWESEDNRPSKLVPCDPMYTVNKGEAEGLLFGGNLNTLCFLGGTDYIPDLNGAILFLEDEGESTSWTERRLFYLEQLGILSQIEGIIFGRPYQFTTDSPARSLESVLSYFGQRHNMPIVADVDIGHTSPMITLPLGMNVKLEARTSRPVISIDESATV